MLVFFVNVINHSTKDCIMWRLTWIEAWIKMCNQQHRQQQSQQPQPVSFGQGYCFCTTQWHTCCGRCPRQWTLWGLGQRSAPLEDSLYVQKSKPIRVALARPVKHSQPPVLFRWDCTNPCSKKRGNDTNNVLVGHGVGGEKGGCPTSNHRVGRWTACCRPSQRSDTDKDVTASESEAVH